MASSPWTWDKKSDTTNILQLCTTFQPGVLDVYDKETKDILKDLKSILKEKGPSSEPQNAEGSNIKFVSPGHSSGPGPPFAQKTKARSLSMENLVNTLITRDSFSENYIRALRVNTKIQEEAETQSEPSRNLISKATKPKRKPKARVLKPDVVTSSAGSSVMADLKVSPSDLGALTISSQDPSIKKFKILPPIDGEQLISPCESPGKDKLKSVDSQGRDTDFNDPSNFGWHVSGIEKWNMDTDNKTSYIIVQDKKEGTQKPPKKLVKSNTSKSKLLTGPSPISNQYKVANMTGKPLPETMSEDSIISNSYVAMSMMTSGQMELKKHLRHRQRRRETDQKDFQEESVTGKPVNAQTLYTINYGDMEVPTTDVEMFAILSVEKHNSPFVEEFTRVTDNTVKEKPFREKLVEKLDNIVEKDLTKTNIHEDISKYKPIKQDTARISEDAPDRVNENSNVQTSDIENKSDSNNSSNIYDPRLELKGGVKIGHLVSTDTTRPRRKTKFGTVFKCYDTTKPLLRVRQSEISPIVLKPLVSAAPLDEQSKLSSHSNSFLTKATPSTQEPQTSSKYIPPRPVAASTGSVVTEVTSAKGKRISVRLPTVICDDVSTRDEASPFPDQSSNFDEESLDPTEKEPSRWTLNPSRVMLGSPSDMLNSDEYQSSAGSRASSSSGSITKNSNPSARQRSEPNSQMENDSVPSNAADSPKFAVMGASLRKSTLTPTQQLGFSNTNMNNSNNNPPTPVQGNNSNSVPKDCIRRVAPPRIGVSIRKITSCPSFNETLNSTSKSIISVVGEASESRRASAASRSRNSEAKKSGVDLLMSDSKQVFIKIEHSGLSAKGSRIGSLPELRGGENQARSAVTRNKTPAGVSKVQNSQLDGQSVITSTQSTVIS